jgi:hypothetical protein
MPVAEFRQDMRLELYALSRTSNKLGVRYPARQRFIEVMIVGLTIGGHAHLTRTA